jgi:nucleoid-associated protein YgaU
MFARIVVITALLTLAVAWGARQSDGAGHQETYLVRAGDTLWAIAAAHYRGDPREGVYRLEQRNHLAGALVQPGQRLVLP